MSSLELIEQPATLAIDNKCRKTGYNLPVVEFKKITDIVLIQIPEELYKSFNNDCKQLYEHWVAIQTGQVPTSLQKKDST